jgi:hypothetical protein
LFRLFSAPCYFSDALCLFPALPFFFLVPFNPRFERVERVAFGKRDSGEVEKGQITSRSSQSRLTRARFALPINSEIRRT